MIVHRMVDHPALDVRRDHQSGNSDAEAIELESELRVGLRDRVARRNGRWWLDVVVERAMLGERDDQQAVVPVRRIANRLIYVLDEPLAACDVVEWMHRIAAREIAGAGHIKPV